jgi:aspartate kinase
MLAATGEQASSALLAIALQAEGMESVSYAGWQVPIRTNSAYTKARIESIDDQRVRADLTAGKVVIVTGFQGIDDATATSPRWAAAARHLGRGRGGRDEGRRVPDLHRRRWRLHHRPARGARGPPLHTISFEEMLEMASLGSKVLQIRSVEFAGKYKVPMRVLSSFTPWDIDINEEAKSGTLITFEEDEKMEQAVVSGIAFNRDEAKISVLGVPDKPGIAYQILGPVADANIEVDVIIQNVSKTARPTSASPCTATTTRTIDLLKKRCCRRWARRSGGRHQDLQGLHRRHRHAQPRGRGQQDVPHLSEEGINIQMISTSEIKTSVVIDEKYMELAVRACTRPSNWTSQQPEAAACVRHNTNAGNVTEWPKVLPC